MTDVTLPLFEIYIIYPNASHRKGGFNDAVIVVPVVKTAKLVDYRSRPFPYAVLRGKSDMNVES